MTSFGCDAGHPLCESPETVEDGLERCANGLVRRTEATTCASSLPQAETCALDPDLDTCASDADCTEQPNGYCSARGGFDSPSACGCVYGCTTDEDCAGGGFCRCADPVGYCETASCRTNADCGEDLSCAEYKTDTPSCGGGGFACQAAADLCAVTEDCDDGLVCAYDGKKRDCVEANPCAVGRPFLVEGCARVAPVVSRGDWRGATELDGLRVDGLDARTRKVLAARWMEIGAMEHASVAAFARFTLELCGQGAPPDFLADTQRALADEVRHAEAAFSLASRLAGRDVGPGPLPLGGVRIETSPEALLRTLFREGCLGETVAALEAGAGARLALDPVVRRLLSTIERDEGEHAALAWKVAAWLVNRLGDQGAKILRYEWARACATDVANLDAGGAGDDLSSHGLLPAGARAALRREALSSIVGPAVAHIVATMCATSARDQRGFAASHTSSAPDRRGQ